jgi:hypothetical protein
MRPLVLLLLMLLASSMSALVPSRAQAQSEDSAQGTTLILAEPEDPYYALAEEIAQSEGFARGSLAIVHTLDEVLEQGPLFLLWVVSPSHLSDQDLVDFGLAMRGRRQAISLGIISGITIGDARVLWLRAAEVNGDTMVAANAGNPSGHIEAGLHTFSDGQVATSPLTKVNFLEALQDAGYLTFTGHGGDGFLGLDEDTTVRPVDFRSLPPIVVATGSCNTFRPWEGDSIALAFTGQGAAAYAGFAYSPNEGYLIGEFDGLPFRYTWADFPIGHVVQVQNHGTLQGFAQFPYYYLLGDPRIALQDDAPYHLVESHSSGDSLVLSYDSAPPGMIPVRVPGGVRYSFVEVPGVSAAWQRDPFYNARLQMEDIGGDKYVLFEHRGGDFTLRLRPNPPVLWLAGDLLLDALDTTLLYQRHSDLFACIVAGLAWLGIGWRLTRKRADARLLLPSAAAGVGIAALYCLYAFMRLDRLSVTSKFVEFSPLAVVGTLLLASCGAFLTLRARSSRGRVVGVALASLGALAPVVFALGIIAISNLAFARPELGVGLWNYALGLQPMIALGFELFLFALTFLCLSRVVPSTEKGASAL